MRIRGDDLVANNVIVDVLEREVKIPVSGEYFEVF